MTGSISVLPPTLEETHIEMLTISAARLLAADLVEKAGSGHPGTAVALAPLATLLFRKFIKHDPADPTWNGRDRFILSCGHASALLYTQLFLSGYDVSLDDLKAFRTLDSNTPGHPEFGCTPGVEATTGPLGQGIAMGVGMAMSFVHEEAVFDPRSCGVVSPFHRKVWVLASDGDLQEGLSEEAIALAGRMSLDNLIVLFDNNSIQIEGDVALTSVDDIEARFKSHKWIVDHVALSEDGDIDIDALERVLARTSKGGPRLVIVDSQIAFPSPGAVGTAASHGAPLGPNEVKALRDVLGVTSEAFEVPSEVLKSRDCVRKRGRELHDSWDKQFEQWRIREPDLAEEYDSYLRKEVPGDIGRLLPSFAPGQLVSTRDASGAVIQVAARELRGVWGGSADLGEPNRTIIADEGAFLPSDSGMGDYSGRNIHWGVREHAMAAAMNGIALSGSWRVFGGTFLVFSDYQRPAIRLAALMNLPVIYVWSHDSVAVGQDGPTHQPIEHLASLRAIPGLAVVRPADANETVAAWKAILGCDGPVGLVLGRQNVPVLGVNAELMRDGVAKGAYFVKEVETPDIVLVGTGSEVALALEAAEKAAEGGVQASVVSMPCREWFLQQDKEYRNGIVPPDVPVIVVEAGSTFGWKDLAPHGVVLGIDEFGLSAPADEAMEARGMTVSHLLAIIREVLA